MWASIFASTSGLVRKLGSSAGAALPLALGGADVFGFVLIMSLYGLCLFRIAGLLNRQSDSRTQWVIGCIGRGKIGCRGLHLGGFKGVEALFHIVHGDAQPRGFLKISFGLLQRDLKL